MYTPLAPEHIRMAVSLVDSWPSTETRSKDRFRQTPSSRSAVSGASAASVWTKQSIVAKRGEIMPAPLHWALRPTTAPDGRRDLQAGALLGCVGRLDRQLKVPGALGAELAGGLGEPAQDGLDGELVADRSGRGEGDLGLVAADGRGGRVLGRGGVLEALLAGRGVGAARVREHGSKGSRRQRARVTSTGAAGRALAVKRAALTGTGPSQTSRPRSVRPLGLMPQATPAARKPAGSGTSGPRSRTCAGRGTQRE